MSAASNQIDLAEAQRFLDLLGPGEQFTFQTFEDKASPTGKRSQLSRILHGTLDQRQDELCHLHEQGAGVFVMVNRGDGKGRKTENVISVRANYVDLDGAPLEPILESPAYPSIIVNSSPGRWHAYWLVSDEPLDDFPPAQLALIQRFNGDPKIHDLPHVMRVPGFWHRKAAPFLTRMTHPTEIEE